MLHNTHRPMEYANSIGYYDYSSNDRIGDANFAPYNVESYGGDNYAYNEMVSDNRVDNYHRREVAASFYQSHPHQASGKRPSQHAFADKISQSMPANADFNANVPTATQNPIDASPPAYNVATDSPIKPALPTFPWMNYSSEDGKRKRQSYSRRQTLELEKEFRYSEYLTKKRRSELCHMLQLSEKQIKTWFQNRRMKKKKEKEKHFEIPKPNEPEIPAACATTLAKTESPVYAWDKTVAATSPLVAEEPYKCDRTPQFVPDTSRVYFNTPYEMNYT